MNVRGIEGLTLGELIDEVRFGGRFVVFNACVGLLLTSVERPSPIYFVRAADAPRGLGAWQTLLTLLLGWWALPGGPVRAWRCVRENLSGGRDVTAAVLRHLARAEHVSLPRPPAPSPARSTAA